MIIPCIDLMDGKVVQLVQGRKKALEGKSLDEMLRLFAGFPQIQVIDLDAAMGRGSNDASSEVSGRNAPGFARAAASALSNARKNLSPGCLSSHRRYRRLRLRRPQSARF